MTFTVTSVALHDIMPLRVAVLRKGTPATDCNYPEDAYPVMLNMPDSAFKTKPEDQIPPGIGSQES